MASEPAQRRTIRDQQRDLTKSELVAAAADVFSTRGYVAATVGEIVAHAGAGRTTFYMHFSSKRDVLTEALVPLRTAIDAMRERLFALPSLSVPDLDAWIEEYIELYTQYGALIAASLEAEIVERDLQVNVDVVDRVVRQWHEHGLAPDDVQADDLRARTMFFTLGVQRFLEYWLVRGWPVDRSTAIRTIRDAWLATGFQLRSVAAE